MRLVWPTQQAVATKTWAFDSLQEKWVCRIESDRMQSTAFGMQAFRNPPKPYLTHLIHLCRSISYGLRPTIGPNELVNHWCSEKLPELERACGRLNPPRVQKPTGTRETLEHEARNSGGDEGIRTLETIPRLLP